MLKIKMELLFSNMQILINVGYVIISLNLSLILNLKMNVVVKWQFKELNMLFALINLHLNVLDH
jgi:hypothetical protein